MKSVLFVIFALLSPAIEAQVVKCKDAKGRITYADHHCPLDSTSGETVKLNNIARDDANARRIDSQTAYDQGRLSNMDADRAARREESRQAYLQGERERQAKAEKCASYEREKAKAKQWENVWRTPALKDMERERGKQAGDSHFSECFGSR